jgi:hypothetical protein
MMNKHLLPRIGTFFILIGCGFLILFIGSILAGELGILYLLFAGAALFLGSVFHRLAPHPEPARFSSIRKISQRSRLRREEKQSEKDQEK